MTSTSTIHTVAVVSPDCDYCLATGRNVQSVRRFNTPARARLYAARFNLERCDDPRAPVAVVEGDPVTWYDSAAVRRFYAQEQ